jgi:hypothetical protein
MGSGVEKMSANAGGDTRKIRAKGGLNARTFPVASRAMQFISLGAVAAGAATPPDSHLVFQRLGQFVERDDVRWLWYFTIAMLIGTQLLSAVWTWIASKVVVRGENATIGNAFKVWLAYLILPLVIGGGLIFFGPLVLETLSGLSPVSAWALFGAFVFLCVLLVFLIPMRIYEIEFLNALGFVLLSIAISIVGNGAVQIGLRMALGVEARVEALASRIGKTDAERSAFAARLFGKDAPDEIDRMLDDAILPIGKPAPLPERETAAKVIQQKLEARRRALLPGDTKALADFQPRLDRYLRLLNELKAERATQPPPAADSAK